MATPLAGIFESPTPQRGMRENISRALGGFGAGVQGRGPEYVAAIQAQDKQLDMDRQKAMAQDAMQVYNMLGTGKYDDAIGLIDRRVQAISQLGGDPSDTLEIRQLITSGRIPEATQELEGFLGQAMQAGIIEAPAAPKFLEMRDGQAIMQNPNGSISAQVPQGYQAPAASSSANMGLSPVWLQNEQGQYVPAQLSSAGGMQPLEVPQGMRAIPPSGQLGFDPNAIAVRGQAQTGVDVSREQAMRPEVAGTAGAVRSAQEQAAIGSLTDRAEAERAASRITEQGARTGAVQTREDQFGLLSDLVDVAKSNSSNWTTGFVGSALSKVPGTPAYDLGRTLDTLQASAGFETLQQMRDNSPTGGALGSITERELALLQATWSSLQQSQSKDQFESNLDRFQRQLEQSWNRVNNAYERDYGVPYFEGARQAPQGTTQSSAPAADPLGIL